MISEYTSIQWVYTIAIDVFLPQKSACVPMVEFENNC